jgi:hypothetical protein
MRLASVTAHVGLAFLIGAAAVASWAVPTHAPAWRLGLFCGCVAVSMVSALLSVRWAARSAGIRNGIVGLTVTPLLLILFAFADLLVINSVAGRLVIPFALFVANLAYSACFGPSPGKAGRLDGIGVSFAIHAVTAFFVLSFASRIVEYVDVPLVASAAAAGVVGAVLAYLTLSRSAPGERHALVSLAIGALCAELAAALSFLPTSAPVNGAAGVIIFGLALHAATSRPGTRPMLRREFAFASLLIVIVLGTARWN